MKKPALLLSCLALSLSAFAASPAAKPASAPKAAASAASAAHAHPAAADTRANVKAAKERGALMSACQAQAKEKSLQDVERKAFMTSCMAGK